MVNNTIFSDSFVAQTAMDYDINIEIVMSIMKKFPDNFYDKLEDLIKEQANKNNNPK